MNMIEWDGELNENDLWKLFSAKPDTQSETILFFIQLKPLLKNLVLKDDKRFYQLYSHCPVPQQPNSSRLRTTVTQRNLYRVACAMAGRMTNIDVAIQYLGTKPS